MSHDIRKPSLDEVVESIRNEEPSRAEIDRAASRVREALGLSSSFTSSPTHIESCAGFQALIPAYLAGELPSQTSLLLEDHSRECIPCRRALIAARTPRAVPAPSAGRDSARPAYTRWAIAAAIAGIAVLSSYTAWQVLPLLGGDPQLKVMRIDGTLYQMTAGSPTALRPGMKVSAKTALRTAKDGSALVMMDDGSRIEMKDRTELTVAKRRDGSTVRLSGGAIIVEASPQGSGHLDVRTDDCLVAVKGTIFAVNTGTKGSRISVVEGAVQVAADGRESLLKPGDQITTTDAVTSVAVGDEIAWSKDAARYVQLLHELAALRKDLDERVPTPGLRYSSKLIDKMPDGTILYAAIPNVTESLVTAKAVFEDHLAQSGALQSWWNQHMGDPSHRREMDDAFEKVKELGSQLGDEIVLALAQGADGRVHGPILMAEVKDKAAFRDALAREMRDVKGEKPEATLRFEGPVVRIEFSGPPDQAAAATRADGTRWDGSPFRAKLQAAYHDGTSWLFGVDLKSMLAHATTEAGREGARGATTREQFERMGVLDAEYLIFERKESADGANVRAEVSFDQPRRGIVGWLAAPAPLGAAEFVSPDAGFAAAAILKRPELLLADALSWIGAGMPNAHAIDDLQPLQGIAATMGGDVAVALDGPALPTPSWKVVIEVYDPVRFQTEFQGLIAKINDEIAASGKQGSLTLAPEQVGNRTDWTVRYTGPEGEDNTMRYAFSDGYLIAAPSRVLIDRAIEQRGNGYTLTRSGPFGALLPADGHVNVSGFLWEHLGPTIGPLAAQVSGVLASADAKALADMAEESKPRLVTAYAEDDRILITSRGGAGLGSMLGSFVSAQRLGAIGEAVAAARAHSAGASATP